jgi:hypothetical protein
MYHIPNNDSFNAAASYFNGPYGDYRDLTIRNRLFVCPQGAREVPWDPNIEWTNTHSNNRALYSIYPGRTISWDDALEKKYTKLRVGQPFEIDVGGGGWMGYRYDPSPLVSDMLWSIGFGMGMATNHVWGGDRQINIHFTPAPLYWSTFTGVGQANFAFEDGSVRQWEDCQWTNLGTTTYSIPSMGVGNDGASRIPKEWGEQQW